MSKIVEEWRPVVGYEGIYEVSDWGNVRSVDKTVNCLVYGKYKIKRHIKSAVLKKAITTWGYNQVMLYKDSIGKHKSVHRLVAEAFIPNPNNLPEINHKDECKTNNTVENLEWCDATYNKNYGGRTNKVAKKLLNRPDQSKKVYQYTMDGELVKIWPSVSECGRNGYNERCIFGCSRGEFKQHKRYLWKIID